MALNGRALGMPAVMLGPALLLLGAGMRTASCG